MIEEDKNAKGSLRWYKTNEELSLILEDIHLNTDFTFGFNTTGLADNSNSKKYKELEFNPESTRTVEGRVKKINSGEIFYSLKKKLSENNLFEVTKQPIPNQQIKISLNECIESRQKIINSAREKFEKLTCKIGSIKMNCYIPELQMTRLVETLNSSDNSSHSIDITICFPHYRAEDIKYPNKTEYRNNNIILVEDCAPTILNLNLRKKYSFQEMPDF